jgi:hypothetical protein
MLGEKDDDGGKEMNRLAWKARGRIEKRCG